MGRIGVRFGRGGRMAVGVSMDAARVVGMMLKASVDLGRSMQRGIDLDRLEKRLDDEAPMVRIETIRAFQSLDHVKQIRKRLAVMIEDSGQPEDVRAAAQEALDALDAS